MIRREENGRFWLIRQSDHAALSGELARLIGNDRFASLTQADAARGERAIVAIARHDSGWDVHDAAPTLNARLNPRDFLEMKHGSAIPYWTASADRAQSIDPYVGLLVSLHGLALSQFSLAEVMHQFSRQNLAYTRERFELNRFQHNEIERQIACREAAGIATALPLNHGLADLGTDANEDLLTFHFRALQAMDRLSLALCCTRSPFDAIELAEQPGRMLTRVQVRRVDSRAVVLKPWVFSVPRIELTVPARSMVVRPFVGEAEFHAEYAHAPAETIPLTLRPDEN